MEAFVLATSDGRLIFESKHKLFPNTKQNFTVGAYVPGRDANYYSDLVIGFYKEDGEFSMGFKSWWDWVKAGFADGTTLIDEDFVFDPDDIRIVPFNIPVES